MTPVHLLVVPPSMPLPALTHHEAPSVFSGLILAFILLALLLQASFFVGLASGRVAGPDARPAAATQSMATR